MNERYSIDDMKGEHNIHVTCTNQLCLGNSGFTLLYLLKLNNFLLLHVDVFGN